MNKHLYIVGIAILFTIFSCKDDKIYTEMKNGKLLKYEYFTNGQLKSVSIYSDDEVLEGMQSFMRPNGKIWRTISWVNNKKIGEAIEYYDNGNIKTYDFYNLDQKVIYKRLYDSSGKLNKEFGEIFPVSFTDINKFNNDGLLYADIYVVEPPNTDVSFKFYLINNKDTVSVPYELREKKIEIRKVIKDKAFNEFAIEAFIKDYDKMKQWDQTNILSLN